jgi:hypothetical protein
MPVPKTIKYINIAISLLIMVLMLLPEINKELFVEKTGQYGFGSLIIAVALVLGILKDWQIAGFIAGFYFLIGLFFANSILSDTAAHKGFYIQSGICAFGLVLIVLKYRLKRIVP